MTNPLLPAELQRALPLRCPIEPVDTRVQFEPDVGPAIIWPMTQEDPFTIPVSNLTLWSYERELLEAFGKTELVGWVLPFDWVDPWPRAGTLVFQFLSKPRYDPVVPAAEAHGRPDQIQYDTSFKLVWRPWFPPAQVG